MKRAAVYARVSTTEQTPENQLQVLRAFTSARGWTVTEFVDHGISGAKDRQPALDAMLADVRRRKVDVVVCTKLDRLARSVKHLVALGEELRALGVELVVLDQAVDTTTSGGRALFGMLAVFAEFERDLIIDRVRAGLARARVQGKKLGRPRIHHVDVAQALALRAQGHSWRATARVLGVHAMAVRRAIEGLSKTPTAAA
jgi:DNA invertase Pin-like site-specific DNA recombinase